MGGDSFTRRFVEKQFIFGAAALEPVGRSALGIGAANASVRLEHQAKGCFLGADLSRVSMFAPKFGRVGRGRSALRHVGVLRWNWSNGRLRDNGRRRYRLRRRRRNRARSRRATEEIPGGDT